LVAGCSSSSSHKPAPPSPSGPVPQSVPNDVAARHDVTLSSCKAAKGGWSAGGTIKNSTHATATYKITIFFTNAHATDLDYAATSVRVAAGKSKPWSTTATFAAPKQVLCVLRGVART
jgi:hypothetical protein